MKPEPPGPVDLVLDLDTGTDDALALLVALCSPEIRLRAVTCASGNVGVDQAVFNTLRVLDAVGAHDVPVARGAEHPRHRPQAARPGRPHGADGLGDLGLPHPRRSAVTEPAESLVPRIAASSARLAYVGCAPFTNLAQLLGPDGRTTAPVRPVILVADPPDGGDLTRDFNTAYDPEAAELVARSGLPVTYLGVRAARAGVVDDEGIGALGASQEPAARLAARLLTWRREARGSASLGDAMAVARLLDPAADTSSAVQRCLDALRAQDREQRPPTAGS